MPGSSDGKSGIGWLVPVCRLTKELALTQVWGTDKVALVAQDGKEIILSLHVGLPFMEWDDFSNDVRKRLAKSHLAGRHPAP
eukprot:12904071-Prorocentrum_lima.AAC.1